MQTQTLVSTRNALHAVAELLLAGPQYRRSGTILLRVRPGGFGTVAEPDLRVEGDHLVAGARRYPLSGTSLARLAAAAGVEAGDLSDVYQGGCGAKPDDPVDVDPDAARYLAACFAAGDEALSRFAPTRQRVLWPEHFDLAVTADEVNYGVSPGDAFLAEPYAYVGPWRQRSGAFWNAPFGAARPVRELAGGTAAVGGAGAVGTVDALVRFFTEGREGTEHS